MRTLSMALLLDIWTAYKRRLFFKKHSPKGAINLIYIAPQRLRGRIFFINTRQSNIIRTGPRWGTGSDLLFIWQIQQCKRKRLYPAGQGRFCMSSGGCIQQRALPSTMHSGFFFEPALYGIGKRRGRIVNSSRVPCSENRPTAARPSFPSHRPRHGQEPPSRSAPAA